MPNIFMKKVNNILQSQLSKQLFRGYTTLYYLLIIGLFAIFFGNTANSQTILFNEDFEDGSFTSRGWYDGSKGTLTTAEQAPSGNTCFECTFLKGQKGCAGGSPSRHLFQDTEEMYVSYWVKYSKNWEGSNKPYHPHEFNILTNAEDSYAGPAITHLTLYIEQNEGKPLLALQDSKNVDQNCILQNNGNFIGCNGDFNSYQFTENRSVAACNGVMGGYDRKDCFFYGSGYYYSARIWDADSVYFRDEQGLRYKNDWHFVEAYFKLNTISGGKGLIDGKIRYWYDGKLLISYDNILMRTAQFPDMKFNQFLIAPYIGDGSPLEQTMWIDNLTVATSRPAPNYVENSGTSDSDIILEPARFNRSENKISIGFSNSNPANINCKIYNVLGREIATISDREFFRGKHSLELGTEALPQGIYFYRLTYANQSYFGKVLVWR